MINISNLKENISLTLDLAILGYLGYHGFRWILNKGQKTEKIDQVAQKSLDVSLDENSFSLSNTINSSHSKEKVRGEEISSKQEFEDQKNLAAVKIQSAYRGQVVRFTLKKLQVEKLKTQRSRDIVKIQSICRGHSARIRVEEAKKSLISYALLEKAKFYIDTPSNLEGMPRASSGTTRVYLPKELPIVLKHSGTPANQKRFDQMQQGRDICEKSGYKQLVIPKARVYGNFIVESRLPITMHETKQQIGLYIENRERFTSAVKEFIGFLCQSCFDNITGNENPYGALSTTPVGRYDNIALYLEEDQGKVGLIDLERFSPGCTKSQKGWCFIRCLDAVHLFPHHLDEIISVAKKFDSNIETYRKDLEEHRNESLKRFKIIYDDHLDFVRKKDITLENPITFEKLGLTRLEQLKKIVEIELRKENDEPFLRGCLGNKPDETLICFNEKAFPKILDAVYKLINDHLEFNLQSNKSPLSSNAQLLSVRTLNFYRQNEDFLKTTSKAIEMLNLERFEISKFASLVLHVILQELEKGKEISYYNPNLGEGDRSSKCIFC